MCFSEAQGVPKLAVVGWLKNTENGKWRKKEKVGGEEERGDEKSG